MGASQGAQLVAAMIILCVRGTCGEHVNVV